LFSFFFGGVPLYNICRSYKLEKIAACYIVVVVFSPTTENNPKVEKVKDFFAVV
jgi:hypothetical protein